MVMLLREPCGVQAAAHREVAPDNLSLLGQAFRPRWWASKAKRQYGVDCGCDKLPPHESPRV